MIFTLTVLGLVALGMVAYYAWKDIEEHNEIVYRLKDLEVATNGYCNGELNGAFSRMLKRQKRDK